MQKCIVVKWQRSAYTNSGFVSPHVARRSATQLGTVIIWLFCVARHGATQKTLFVIIDVKSHRWQRFQTTIFFLHTLQTCCSGWLAFRLFKSNTTYMRRMPPNRRTRFKFQNFSVSFHISLFCKDFKSKLAARFLIK
jgi:hypothetical protein